MKKAEIRTAHKKREYEYEIMIDNKIVWKGLNPKMTFLRICDKYPEKEISLKWKGKKGVLIA